jgi:CSLREA domain-containing protein
MQRRFFAATNQPSRATRLARRVLVVMLLLGLFRWATPVAANGLTFTVDSLADDADAIPGDGLCSTGTGFCTLRAAIEEANAQAGPDVINFNIPGAGIHIIQVLPFASLPTIISPVTIDGCTQPGASCAVWPPTLRIEIEDKTGIAGATGLLITAGNSTVRGLALHHFNDAIYLDTLGGNTIESNFFGTDATGTLDRGNGIQSGVWNNGTANNTIGGPLARQRNLFAGSNYEAIRLAGLASSSNLVQGNYIGTDVTGTTALGWHSWGILITGPNNQVRDNVIVGANYGLWLTYIYATGNLVQGNRIGVNAAGIATGGGSSVGIYIIDGASSNLIGGPNLGEGNTIARTGVGISVQHTTTPAFLHRERHPWEQYRRHHW